MVIAQRRCGGGDIDGEMLAQRCDPVEGGACDGEQFRERERQM